MIRFFLAAALVFGTLGANANVEMTAQDNAWLGQEEVVVDAEQSNWDELTSASFRRRTRCRVVEYRCGRRNFRVCSTVVCR